MNSKELYEFSLEKSNKKIPEEKNQTGLSNRLYNLLARHDLAENYQIKKYEVLEMILSGKIWDITMMGKKSVIQICDWLEPQLNKDNTFKEEEWK